MNKTDYKAYHRGIRMARKLKITVWNRIPYNHNPYKYHSREWYMWNCGWNETLV